MPPPTKRKQHLARIRHRKFANAMRRALNEQEYREMAKKKPNPPTYIFPKQMAVGCLMTGTNHQNSEKLQIIVIAKLVQCQLCTMLKMK